MSVTAKQLVEYLKKQDVEAFVQALPTAAVSVHELLARIRAVGALRASRFHFEPKPVLLAIDAIDRAFPARDENATAYLNSIRELQRVGPAAAKELKELVRQSNLRSFKSHLVALDHLFHYARSSMERTAQESLRPDLLSKEQLATGFSSYFMHLVEDKGLPQQEDLQAVNVRHITDGHYRKVLKRFCALSHLREAEVLVDAYGYLVKPNGRDAVMVAPPSQEFSRAMSFGFLRQQSQGAVDVADIGNEYSQAGSLVELMDIVVQKSGEFFFETVSSPVARIRFKLPQEPRLLALFQQSGLFKEEVVDLAMLSKELFVTFDQLNTIPIFKSLTAFDLVRLRRFFQFRQLGLHHYCVRHGYLESSIYYNSLIALHMKDSAAEIFGVLYGPQKAAEFLELLTWDPACKSVFDVQYQPIIPCESGVVTPLGIMATANFVRNTLSLKQFRFYSDGDNDPVAPALKDQLKHVGMEVRTGISYKWKGDAGDVDVIALLGGHVFVFECKNSLLPCSSFELRTSLDYVNKAARQLTQFSRLFQDAGFRDYFTDKAKLPRIAGTQLATAIIMGNRMFPGLRVDGHPVRPLYELINLLDRAEWTLGTEQPGVFGEGPAFFRFSLRRAAHFQVDDLYDYLGDEKLYQAIAEAMETVHVGHQIGRSVLYLEQHMLNYRTLISALQNKYSWEGVPVPVELLSALKTSKLARVSDT